MELDEILPIFGSLYNFGLHSHKAISKKAEIAVHRFAMMIKLNAKIAHEGKLRPLLYLLQRDRHAQATDPRNRIYGLLGLSKEAKTANLNPNYAESLRDLFLRTTKYFARNTSVPLLLESAGICAAEPDMPSWVPC